MPHVRPLRLAVLCAVLAAGSLGAQDRDQPSIELYRGVRPTEYKIAILGPTRFASPGYAIRARKVLPVTTAPIQDGIVLTKDGKIIAVGPAAEVQVPEGFTVIDVGDRWLVPGFVDLHCHIAASGTGDINDMSHQTNPEMRTLDLITLDHENIRNALAGGVTAVNYIPGSGTNMGGFGTLTKTGGSSPEEALIRFPGCLKIAQAGNPERGSGDLGAGRIGMNHGIRATLLRGKRYNDLWEAYDAGRLEEKPEFRPDLHYLRGLFRYEYPVGVHSQVYQVVQETLRQLRRELGLWTVIIHGEFGGQRLCEEMLKSGLPVACGPRQYDFDRTTGRIVGLHAAYWGGGDLGWNEPVKGLGWDGIGINTDSPVVPQEELSVQAAMAVRLGLPDAVALRGLTINPARFFGIEDRVGSLDPGKDADLVVWTGDPIDPRSWVEKVFINGNVVYDVTQERRRF
jgi:imidazolonepropionase-like amidohydrolase